MASQSGNQLPDYQITQLPDVLSIGRELDAPARDADLAFTRHTLDHGGGVAVFVDPAFVLGDPRRTVGCDDDALSRKEVDDVGVPVIGARISDLTSEQELCQLGMWIGLRI